MKKRIIILLVFIFLSLLTGLRCYFAPAQIKAADDKLSLRAIYLLSLNECFKDKNINKKADDWIYICQKKYINEFAPYLIKDWKKIYNKCAKNSKDKDICIKKSVNFEPKHNFRLQNWEKLSDNIYLDLNSLDQQDDYSTGIFKEIVKDKETINNQTVKYKLLEFGAYCDLEKQDYVKKLEYPIIEYYDSNNKFITENNIHAYWRVNYPGGHLGITYPDDIDNGDIYFNSLCGCDKVEKPKKTDFSNEQIYEIYKKSEAFCQPKTIEGEEYDYTGGLEFCRYNYIEKMNPDFLPVYKKIEDSCNITCSNLEEKFSCIQEKFNSYGKK